MADEKAAGDGATEPEEQPDNTTFQILIAMTAGAAAGLALNLFTLPAGMNVFLVDGVFRVIGTIFINSLKMLVVPLVFISLVGGVTALGDPKALGRIGAKALGLYLLTTAFAISVALALAAIVSPGSAAGLERPGSGEFVSSAPPSLGEVLISMVPTNPVAAMANGEMLQIIVFALLFGVAISLSGDRGRHVLNLFEDLNTVIMRVVMIVMKLAPIGVFCLLARTMAELGLDALAPLAGYFVTVLAALFLHGLVSYSLLLRVFAGLNPWMFLSKMRPVWLFAFSTASSNATIPITLRTVRGRLGVKNRVASFTVPLGATINMDGTAIMQGVATVFIANVYGIALTTTDFISVIITATLASVGTAGVPGVGLIMLAMVLEQVGLPVEGIALIIGIDRLLDMVRTAVNVTGDAAVSCIVARTEDALDDAVYADPDARPSAEPARG